MTVSFNIHDVNMLKNLLKAAEDTFSRARRLGRGDPGQTYYWIEDEAITSRIQRAFSSWKALAMDLSGNRLTIVRESTITGDFFDNNTFVITQIAKTLI